MHGPALRGQAERQVAPVDGVDAALHQPLCDKAIDEPARTGARLADQESAELVERQRPVITQDPQDLGL